MTRSFRIGVPSKGRLADIAADLLKEAGLRFRRQPRSLFARVRGMSVDVTFLRTDDVPVLCAEGAIDMGITGSDLVAESGADVNTRMGLGTGKCRLAICVPEDSQVKALFMDWRITVSMSRTCCFMKERVPLLRPALLLRFEWPSQSQQFPHFFGSKRQ